MRKTRMLLKIVAFFLSIVLIVQILPLSMISTAIKNDLIIEQSIAESITDELPAIIGEVESLRDEYTKHFRCEDGSFVAAIYNTPVHYQENNEWKDINNTLIANNNNSVAQTTSGNNSAKYAITETATPITFPENIKNGKITITNGDNIISFGVKNNASNSTSTATISTSEELISTSITSLQTDDKIQNIEKNNSELVVGTKNSAITYANAFENVSIEYEVSSSIIKESIVVSKKSDNYKYEFTIDFGSYIPRVDSNGGIEIFETAESIEPIMAIASPYMFDANNETSEAVTMELVHNSSDYTLVVEADKSWINKLGRKFPVVIDPTFILDVSRDDISDVHVNQNYPNKNYDLDYQLEVGKNNSNVYRTYIKYVLPSLPDCSVVTNAELRLIQNWNRNIDTDLYINVYKCATNWNENSITWNNQPIQDLSQATIVDYTNYKDGMSTEYNLDITKIVKDWYENGENFGFMLASSDETVEEKTSFYSSRNLVSVLGDVQPTVTIQYVNNTGVEDYWTYDGFSLGEAGAAYINTYNGSLAYIHNDVSTNGLLAPLSVSHVYLTNERNASGTFGNMNFGKGFKLNIIEKIESVDSDILNSTYPYKYIDGDGTVHFFVRESLLSNTYYYEFGSDIVLTSSSSGFVMTSPDGSKKEFNAEGYLTKVTDNNGNSITITYSNGRITKVTDGGGGSVDLAYNSNNTLNYISDSTGRKTYYHYNSSGQLDYITYPDLGQTVFSYGDYSLLSSITAPSGAKADLNYKAVTTVGTTCYRVSSYTTYGEDSTTVYDAVDIEYRTCDTYLKNSKDDTVVLAFDNLGRVTNKIVNGETASTAEYNSSGNLNNTVSFASNSIGISYNSFERKRPSTRSEYRWSFNSDNTSNSVIEDSTERTNIHTTSLKLQREETAGTISADHQIWNIEPNTTYTVSMYVNIVDTLECGEVYLKVAACEAEITNTYELFSVKGSSITTTDNQWQMISVTIDTDENTEAFVITCGLYDAIGTVYFDAYQIEKASTPSRMNLLANGNMENIDSSGGAEEWNGIYDAVRHYSHNENGNSYLWIKGSPGEERSYYQYVDMSGKAGDVLVFGASAKALCSSSGNDGTRFFGIRVDLYSDYFTVCQSEIIEFDEQTYNTWQTVMSSITANQDYVRAQLRLCYYHEVNTTHFDNAFLYRDYYGTSYSYNDQGRIEKAESDNGQSVEYYRSGLDGVGLDITNVTVSANDQVTQSVGYSYDSKHNITAVHNSDGTVTRYTYNSNGLPLTTTTAYETLDTPMASTTTYAYTDDGNYLRSVTDAAGSTTEYTYNSRGLVSKVTDPNGNIREYEYDVNTDELVSVENPSEELGNPSTEFEYDDAGRLYVIDKGEVAIYLFYDKFGRLEVGHDTMDSTYFIRNFDENGNLLNQCTAEVGFSEYTYDEDNRLTSEIYDGVVTYEYVYSNDGMLGKVIDHESDVEWNYQYDMMNRPTRVSSNDSRDIFYEYNSKNELNRFKVTDSGETALETTYSYDENGKPVGSQVLSMANSPTQEYTYDLLGRSESFKNYFNGSNYVKTDYSYRIVNGNETCQVRRVSYSANSDEATGINDLPEFEYEYDANGNITHVYGGGFLRIRYHYDGMNRLAREDNLYIDKTIIYNYDRDGDILSKTEYDIDLYDEGLGEPIDVITYSYSESRWMSGITRYDGTDEISYDLNGSPIEYRGYTMSWTKDRQLSEVSGKGIAMSLKYDCNGIRTKKTVNGVETEYTYVGDMLVSQKTGNEIINFAYTAGGAPLGFTYNGTSYFYLLNLQGDIIGIYDANGNVVVGYYYDTWGKLVSIYGTLADTIGVKNPLRYRGYYYDTETSLYYLQSRYYDPETGRFISRDSYLIAGNDIIQGTNMYAYCYNNPVMYVDPTGKLGEFFSNLFSLFSNMFLTDRKGIDENNFEIMTMFRVATESLGYLFLEGQADWDFYVLSSGVVRVTITIIDTYLNENSTAKGDYIIEMYYGNSYEWALENKAYNNQIFIEGIIGVVSSLFVTWLAPPLGGLMTAIGIGIALNPDEYRAMIDDMIIASNGTQGINYGAILYIKDMNSDAYIYQYKGG